ncbi:HPr family phosphocarrier protein [Bacillaceae bacterium S4-13-56]
MDKEIKIDLKTGLQARAAAQFVQEANRFSSEIFIEKDSKRANAKSIMGLMSIALGPGETFTLIAEGKDEEQAIEVLSKFVSTPVS